MYHQLVLRHLGIVAMLIALSMTFSLPWAWPCAGIADHVEWSGLRGLGGAMALGFCLGGVLLASGRRATGHMHRREALAVVGLSWILATELGALPFLLSGTCRGPSSDGNAQGIPMTIVDALFESASGFTGAGATVITDLEDPGLVPRSILFWRSETHFLGGLGILVLFVAVLGQGSSAKAVMRAEMPGPMMESSHARIQQAARAFAAIYLGLDALLTGLLVIEGMNLFDALCHSFGTIATGGFSTYNASVGHFDSPVIDATITVFMAVSCINFALLWAVVLFRPMTMLKDHEFQVYMAILFGEIALIVAYGLYHKDFNGFWQALRYGSFQVTSILTNTGFGTHDFDQWSEFSRGLLLVLMYVGGCAGSTSCSIKVIRYLILWKRLESEIEKAYRSNVVRLVHMDGKPVNAKIIEHVFFYFGLDSLVSVIAVLGLLFFEPDGAWISRGHSLQQKVLDCTSAVAATINGVGPGLGVVGTTQNYAHFHPCSKMICTMLMLLGRLEFIPLLVLFAPSFWRRVA
jgi:trk system potassium uptake protein TrkH